MGGLDARQAITYSVLAALDGWSGGARADRISGRVSDGSSVLLFLRPFPVLRYLLVQRSGGAAYGLLWLAAGGPGGLASGARRAAVVGRGLGRVPR